MISYIYLQLKNVGLEVYNNFSTDCLSFMNIKF